ncbi:MAG: hypothetical protein Q9159_006841 [Coniocarpon cinnabarinum]
MTLRNKTPIFVFLPGSYQTPAHFEPITQKLQTCGYDAVALMLAGRGDNAESAAPLESVTTARARLTELVQDQSREVVLVGCSYAGMIASMAVKGLERSLRQHQGLAGGVTNVVFIAGLLIPEGLKLVDMLPGNKLPPWSLLDEQRGVLMPSPAAKAIFFTDMDEASRDRYGSQLVAQTPRDSQGVIKDACWDVDVPKIYIHTLQDQACPMELQNTMLSRVRSVRPEDWSTLTIESDHSPFLSHVDQTVDLLLRHCSGPTPAWQTIPIRLLRTSTLLVDFYFLSHNPTTTDLKTPQFTTVLHFTQLRPRSSRGDTTIDCLQLPTPIEVSPRRPRHAQLRPQFCARIFTMVAALEHRFVHSVTGLGNLAKQVARTPPAEDAPPFEYTDRALAILSRAHEAHTQVVKEKMEQEFLLQRSHVSSEIRGLEDRLDTRFRWIEKRLDGFEKSVDKRFKEAEKNVNERFCKFEKNVDERFQAVDRRFEKIEGEICDIKGELGNCTAISRNGNLRRMHQNISVIKVRMSTAEPNKFEYTASPLFPRTVKALYALGQAAKGIPGFERVAKQYPTLIQPTAVQIIRELVGFYKVHAFRDDVSDSDATELDVETNVDAHLEELLDVWGMDWEGICELGERHMAANTAPQAGVKRGGNATEGTEKRARA